MDSHSIQFKDVTKVGDRISFYCTWGKIKNERCFEIVNKDKNLLGDFVMATCGDYWLMYSHHFGVVNISKKHKKCSEGDFWNDMSQNFCTFYYLDDSKPFENLVFP